MNVRIALCLSGTESTPDVKRQDEARVRSAVARLFPCVEFAVTPLEPEKGFDLSIDGRDWLSSDFEPAFFDAQLRALPDRECTVAIVGGTGEVLRQTALGFALRYQRLFPARNGASQDELFHRLVARQRTASEVGPASDSFPEERALDAWQWLLRLKPDASLAEQVTSLFPSGETSTAVEVDAVLAEEGVEGGVRRDVTALLANDVRPEEYAERETLQSARALSFLSLAAADYADAFGAAALRRQLRIVVSQIGLAARSWLSAIRLRRDVEEAFLRELSPLSRERFVGERLGTLPPPAFHPAALHPTPIHTSTLLM